MKTVFIYLHGGLCFALCFIKTKSLEGFVRQISEKDREIASLKAECAKLSQKSPMKPKRGLLANIREAVTSPRTSASGRTLRKTVRTAHH